MENLNHGLFGGSSHRAKTTFPADYKNKSLYSLGTERKYARQFFAMYEHRLKMLKPRVDREAHKIWGHNSREVNGKFIQHKEKILDIVSGELCWVSGTIFADMKHKLNILHDVEKGTDDMLPQIPSKYVDDDNDAVVMIEDESGRAILHNPELLNTSGLVTGCVVGVLGIEIQAGIFEIMEIAYPTPAPQGDRDEKSTPEDQWVAFVSGLHVDKETNMDLRLLLLQQWVCGELGGTDDTSTAKNISRLVIVGNSIARAEPEVNDDFLTTNNFGSKNISRFLPGSLLVFDDWLAEVLVSLPVTIIPGETDPCEVCLPQQPMHRSLFGKNSAYVNTDSLTTLTNPTWIEDANGLRALVTSGQNIDDMGKYHRAGFQGLKEVLNAMANTIKWQNIIPTAPDTLYCYPFEAQDPFTLDETPHLYVVGNQAESGSDLLDLGRYKVHLVSVSKFSETGEVVLVNMKTFETKTVNFS
ncbi:DNA polymerase delta subunit 2 [Metschnikowia aff. pulcherrima]|uniref:DNA-directed DNA polymerase n=1 Tax=Metschnikowia aff. pulcherrima TaxID=2163413 RepID=A0A4P6XCU5_9ASCO|nr:DNA polymerase delta subunit 2 [Metschnikowia aff. pulcherrima]